MLDKFFDQTVPIVSGAETTWRHDFTGSAMGRSGQLFLPANE